MDAIQMIKERRSVRDFKDVVVDRKLVEEVIEVSRYSPSWANFQVARYNIIQDRDIITKIAEGGVNGFIYNTDTLKSANNVLVLSYVKGKSGKLEELDEEAGMTSYDAGTNAWEIFDTGIACQTFALTAHAKGLGTVIMGVINEGEIAKIINLPEGEKVAAVVVFGYEEGEHPVPSPRKSVAELTRFM